MSAAPSHDRPCAECGAPLASDQRYCLSCGARRGPLPPSVLAMLGQAAGAEPPAAPVEALEAPPARVTMPSPRVAALAVLGVLAFGVMVGTFVTPPDSSEANSPAILAVAPPPAASTPVPATPTTPEASGTSDVPADTSSSDTSSPSSSDSTPTTPSSTPETPTAPAGPTLPEVRHVFVVMLSGQGFDGAFGASSASPYLAQTLRAKGELLPNYYAVTQGELANGIALISGQGPTPETAANCAQYTDVAPGTVGEGGQVLGNGCVYPTSTQTLASQLSADGRTLKAYVEDLGNGAPAEPATCRHPALGSADPAAAPRPSDAYVTWRNPFMYFHSVIDGPTCDATAVGLDKLESDLSSTAGAPAVSYIVPNRCHDGSQQPCAPDQPAGMAGADAFLRTVVPKILDSPAYKDGGLIAITSDQAPQTGTDADSSSCCTAPQYPNLPSSATPGSTTAPSSTTVPGSTGVPASTAMPDSTTAPGSSGTPSSTSPSTTTVAGTGSPGGGRVGLLLISPFVKPGSTDGFGSFNHFSLLRSIEDLFDLQPLGYAADPALPVFDKVVYNNMTAASGSGN